METSDQLLAFAALVHCIGTSRYWLIHYITLHLATLNLRSQSLDHAATIFIVILQLLVCYCPCIHKNSVLSIQLSHFEKRLPVFSFVIDSFMQTLHIKTEVLKL